MEEIKEVKSNTYEISFLLDNAEDSQIILKHLADFKAEIISEGTVASIELAYEIDKKQSAYFGYIHFKMLTQNTPKLNDVLTLDKKVIRFLIVTPIPQKAVPRRIERVEGAMRPIKKSEAALSNEALEEKLAALKAS